MIHERREDLSRLLSEARLRAEAQLGVGRVNIRLDMNTLYACRWPGHLDEIDHVMQMVVALRGAGSLRRAAALLGTKKSTLANRLRAIGQHVARNPR
jgi:transcriptional regulator of acetoin/glycerol metabolism